MKANFHPPQPNLFLVRLVQLIAPPIARFFYKIELCLSPEDLAILNSLRGERVLLLPNHPTFDDPIAIFLLSARLEQTFHYLAAYEQFKGFLGFIIRQLGAYSIRRGLADRNSIAQTVELLTQDGCKLVIFAEGGCSFQNDTVMPFREGAVQMAFQAMKKTLKESKSLPNFYVVPVSIKYRYPQDMSATIEKALGRLERSLSIDPTPNANVYERLRAIAAQVLIEIEGDYGLYHPQIERESSWNERIVRLRELVLQGCEQRLGIPSVPDDPVRERTYRIEYAFKTKKDDDTSKEIVAVSEGLPNDTQNFEELLKQDELIEKSIIRLLNFDAIYDGYVAENPTKERFLDTLTRLEREVFNIDRPSPKGLRKVRIKIGSPINLKDRFADYQRDRKGTVSAITLQIQQEVQKNLDRDEL
jgi:1-acyl-sn-glycerol-3-phosphate acyltransferase